MAQRPQADGRGVSIGGVCRQALSMRTVPPGRLEQTYALRTRLQPRFTGGRRWSGSGTGNVACEEQRQRLRMGHTEAAGEQSCETSG